MRLSLVQRVPGVKYKSKHVIYSTVPATVCLNFIMNKYYYHFPYITNKETEAKKFNNLKSYVESKQWR